MGYIYRDGNNVSDNIGLLISILVRYPEIGSINLDSHNKKIKFTFIVAELLDKHYIQDFFLRLEDCIDAFLHIKGNEIHDFEYNSWDHSGLITLEISRDVETISQDEIALVVALVNEMFGGMLIIDVSGHIEEDIDYQEQLIGDILKKIPTTVNFKNLYAYRDEGKVMVFNK